MKVLAALALVLVFTATADAATRKRTRITVQPHRFEPRPVVQHPFAVQFALETLLCAFHVFSIGPQGKPGSCADRVIHHRRV